MKQHRTLRPLYQRALVALLLVLVLCGATSLPRTRKSILAGAWFPSTPQAVYTAARQYIDSAPEFKAPGKMVACLVPHAPMALTGPLAAPVFRQIPLGAYDRVIVLTNFHYGTFRGCSIPAVQFYESPLGTLPVDTEIVHELTWNPLITTKSVSYNERLFASGQRTPLHEKEHGIEAVLPYLQAQLGTFRLVPIVMGELKNFNGEPDVDAIESIARSIRPHLTENTLIVVAAHLTRYGIPYRFTPFETDVQDGIRRLDLDAVDLVAKRDLPGYLAYLKRTKNPLEGAMALALLIHLLPSGVKGEVMNYTTSGRIMGNSEDSTSYAAVGFYNPAVPVPTAARTRPELLDLQEPEAPDEEPVIEGAPVPVETEAAPAAPRDSRPEQ